MERRYLVLDRGNTRLKATLYTLSDSQPASVQTLGDTPLLTWLDHVLKCDTLHGVIYAASGHDDDALIAEIEERYGVGVERLSRSTPLPIEVCYDTPQTLGLDRVALACGAVVNGEGIEDRLCIVADAGTALTLDVVYDRAFHGGDIAPGMKMRLDALHERTARLPLVDPHGPLPAWGRDTLTAIRCGVCRGMAAEIAIFAAKVAKTLGRPATIILTGGDAPVLEAPLREALPGMSAQPDADIHHKEKCDGTEVNTSHGIHLRIIPSLTSYGLLACIASVMPMVKKIATD